LASLIECGEDFWQAVKLYIRQIHSEYGVLTVDDSISTKRGSSRIMPADNFIVKEKSI
jgi:hypothetical protein